MTGHAMACPCDAASGQISADINESNDTTLFHINPALRDLFTASPVYGRGEIEMVRDGSNDGCGLTTITRE